ncbi:hypothetical protein [Brevibacillus daliensis]|uniref:hypothetical protein n=1 Tax=Brevibacillus daliensis TaxID=2892995 RepID=UPI001E436B65|nr:hypothetical protein [Brevibacillus daliensis]
MKILAIIGALLLIPLLIIGVVAVLLIGKAKKSSFLKGSTFGKSHHRFSSSDRFRKPFSSKKSWKMSSSDAKFLGKRNSHHQHYGHSHYRRSSSSS